MAKSEPEQGVSGAIPLRSRRLSSQKKICSLSVLPLRNVWSRGPVSLTSRSCKVANAVSVPLWAKIQGP